MNATAPPAEVVTEADTNPCHTASNPVPPPPMPDVGALGPHEAYVRSLVRSTSDWPRPGTIFMDLSPLFADSRGLRHCIDSLAERYSGGFVTHIAGIDARGLPIACALAYALKCGFIMIRKAGKLPPRSPDDSASLVSEEYEMEYGRGQLQISSDLFDVSQVTSPRILLVDDVVATGGTAISAVNLLRSAGATLMEVAVIMELQKSDLNGRRRLKEEAFIDLHSLLTVANE